MENNNRIDTNNNRLAFSLGPIMLIFIAVTAFLLLCSSLVAGWGVDYRVPLFGNVLLFAVTIVSFALYVKGLRDANPHVFVRMAYSSMLVKLLVCMLAVLIYVLAVRQGANRNGIIGCFILYVLYTVLEIRALQRLSRSIKKNA